MINVSIDIDAQKGFTDACPNELPVKDGLLIVDELNKNAHLSTYRICTKDAHPSTAEWIADEDHPQLSKIDDINGADVYWNAHCIVGTKGFELIDGLPHPSEYDFIVYKGVEKDMHPYGACYHDLQESISTGLIEYIRDIDPDYIIVGGLALDYCVWDTVRQLLQNVTTPIIINLSATKSIGDIDKVIEDIKHVAYDKYGYSKQRLIFLRNAEEIKKYIEKK